MNHKNEQLNELALFAGAGGGILGGHLLGWRCVCAVEWEPYPAGVLIARQNEGILPPFPIWDDVRTFDGRPWRGIVDVVSGGFPCQDISAAGKGAGITGERSGMWRHMARIIGEVRPRYVLVENSPVLTSRGLGVVLGDLAALGYDAEWGVLGAVHAGAPHNRERIWILAHTDARDDQRGQGKRPRIRGAETSGRSNDNPCGSGSEPIACSDPIGHVAYGDLCGRLHRKAEEFAADGRFDAQREPEPSGEDVADATGEQGRGLFKREFQANTFTSSDGGGEAAWWSTEPNVGGNVDGLAEKLDHA